MKKVVSKTIEKMIIWMQKDPRGFVAAVYDKFGFDDGYIFIAKIKACMELALIYQGNSLPECDHRERDDCW